LAFFYVNVWIRPNASVGEFEPGVGNARFSHSPMTENNKSSELLETSVVWIISAVVAVLGFLLMWLALSLVDYT
jgi:hypothetical protein